MGPVRSAVTTKRNETWEFAEGLREHKIEAERRQIAPQLPRPVPIATPIRQTEAAPHNVGGCQEGDQPGPEAPVGRVEEEERSEQ
jgi:hypothetical protein